jgi:hypothetical protein
MADQRPPVNEPRDSWGWYPWSRRGSRRGGARTGVLLIAFGAFFLLANLGLLEWLRWDLVWPVGLILFGIWLVSRRR